MSLERRQLLAGIGGIATLSVAGCLGGDDDQPTTLWHDFSDAEETDLVEHAERFNEERDDELNLEAISEIEDQLSTAIPAGDGPETFAWAHDWVGNYHEQGFAYDAADDVNLDLDATFTDAAADAVRFDGAVYGIPYGAETVALMYNEELVDGPPETLEELVEIMDDYHDPAEGQYGLSCPPADPYFTSTFLHAFGGYFFDDETESLGVDQDEFIEGVELLQESIWPYVPQDPAYESQVPVFDDGNAPFAINGPWEIDGFRDSGIETTVAPMPDIAGGDPTPFTGIQVWYFTATLEDADEEALETAIDWAEWHSTDEDVILTNAENHGFIPVHQEYADDDELGDDVEAFAENVAMGVQMPSHPRMDQVWNPVEDALEQVFNEQESAEDAMNAAADEIRGRWE
ncbi:extracellular solute-binding protein [Natrialba swarupiae]|uniref:Extracellular solute-binding protein n=1 Tax=Natrialba swarupiae TaxID=2448032 RepID=A0A5D5AHY7_9EURY|nr:extracellular solute-binding protein [Natrialba swarupiae]TYT60543.1 extracellular solute-binding protein [Natrialba swarupiae]